MISPFNQCEIYFQVSKSTSNLQELTYAGRPRGEEPHVIRKVKRKQEHIEYIVRVDLVSLSFIDMRCSTKTKFKIL